MIVGVLTIDLLVVDARSLKDKRRVVLSLTQKLRNRFNVSVSEVEHWDDPRRCRLGVALIARESRPTHAQLDKVVELVRKSGGLTLLDYQREFF